MRPFRVELLVPEAVAHDPRVFTAVLDTMAHEAERCGYRDRSEWTWSARQDFLSLLSVMTLEVVA